MRCATALATLSLVCVVGCSRHGTPEAPASDSGTAAQAKNVASASASSTPAPSSATSVGKPAAALTDGTLAGPATLTEVNVAASDMGGAIEELTGSYGPGLTGRRLIDGSPTPTWIVPAQWSWNPGEWAKYPVEVVLSFYERQPALVGAVTIALPEADAAAKQDPDAATAAPKDVEVWISKDNSARGYVKVATHVIEPRAGDQTITFPAIEARFVKLRVLSGVSHRELEMAELRVLEAARTGYTPLFNRFPEVQFWKGSPREAAQRGLDWLQQAAADWNQGNSVPCFGCHVQAQALMGQAVALKEGYRVSLPALHDLTEFIYAKESPEGTWREGGSESTAAVFGAMGLASAASVLGTANGPKLQKAVDYVMAQQETDGSIPEGRFEPPILQGRLMMTANALVAMRWAAAHSWNPRSAQAAERALAWISAHEPETTQDRVFKVVSLMQYGAPEQKRVAWSVVEDLAAAQQPDGGWKENAATDGSNAFATGQALYAFKQAGVSRQSAMFRRGVDYLLKTQVNGTTTPASGSWKAVHTQSEKKSDFAPTMWAVIGLANAYGSEPKGALQVVRQGDKSAARNLEIVLDVSGSMNTPLGDGTRWTTALQVLKDVVASLPGDLNVGLRAYGHRYPSKSAQTCQDTELVVPIGKLDRDRIVNVTSQLKPRGETPLVRSVLKTVGDLKAVGGGSVILITDGEESCQGNAQAAAREIKASGVNVTLNIIGFTLMGKATEAQLGSLAGSTGGHYYGAQDGEQLARAVKLAALQRVPYDVLNAAGQAVASGQTSELARELPPGSYRVRLQALGQVLEEPVSVVAEQMTTLRLEVAGDHFVARH